MKNILIHTCGKNISLSRYLYSYTYCRKTQNTFTKNVKKTPQKTPYLYKYWYYTRKSGNQKRFIFLQKFYLPIKEYISCFLFSRSILCECLMRYAYDLNLCKILRVIIIRDTKLIISRFVWYVDYFWNREVKHHHLKTILDHRMTSEAFYQWKFLSRVRKRKFVFTDRTDILIHV